MSKYNGTGMTITFNSSAWANNFLRSVDWNEEANVADTTGASDTWETHGVINKKGEATVEMFDDSALATVQTKLLIGTSSTLVFDPGSDYTRSVTATVIKVNTKAIYNDYGMITATFKFSGAVTPA